MGRRTTHENRAPRTRDAPQGERATPVNPQGERGSSMGPSTPARVVEEALAVSGGYAAGSRSIRVKGFP